MSGHTEGFWQFDDAADVVFRVTGETSATDEDIAHVVTGNPHDGRLISAAPDLLGVARSFLDVLEADDVQCTCAPGDVCPLCRTKAAITKATR